MSATKFHTHTKQQAKLSSVCTFLYSPVSSSLLGPNILLNTLFSNTLSLRSSLNVSDQFSHPYKTTGKIILSMYFSLFPCYPSLLGPNILLNALFSYTLSLRFSLNVSDQVSHPYKTTGKIKILYILIWHP